MIELEIGWGEEIKEVEVVLFVFIIDILGCTVYESEGSKRNKWSKVYEQT